MKESEEEKKEKRRRGPWTEIGSNHRTAHNVALTLIPQKPPEGQI